jgi:hypothetical protein
MLLKWSPATFPVQWKDLLIGLVDPSPMAASLRTYGCSFLQHYNRHPSTPSVFTLDGMLRVLLR